MKHWLIVLLSIISLTSFGIDLSDFVEQEYDLTFGITFPELIDATDFTNIKPKQAYTPTHVQEWNFMDEGITNSWYHTDFAEDPFDGVIDIFVIGQPSTSTNVSLIVAFIVMLFLCMYKRIIQKGFNDVTTTEKGSRRWAQ